jgi:hypothetical protein
VVQHLPTKGKTPNSNPNIPKKRKKAYYIYYVSTNLVDYTKIYIIYYINVHIHSYTHIYTIIHVCINVFFIYLYVLYGYIKQL